MKIIVDVMGGDNAPLELVKGACRAYEETGVDLLLVGNKEEIEGVAEQEKLDISHFEILDAKETVEMTDDQLMVKMQIYMLMLVIWIYRKQLSI